MLGFCEPCQAEKHFARANYELLGQRVQLLFGLGALG